MGWLKLLFGAPLEIVGKAYESRQQRKAEERQIDAAIRMKKIEYVNQGRIGEVEWNRTHAAQNSWKDEWLTLLLSVPMIMAFGPDSWQTQVADGFKHMQGMPDWYKASVAVMIGAAFGYQKYTNTVMNRAFRLPNQIQSSVEALNEADKA